MTTGVRRGRRRGDEDPARRRRARHRRLRPGTARSTAAGRGSTCRRREYAELTNPRSVRGTADEVLAGADVFIGVSAPGAVRRRARADGDGRDRLRDGQPDAGGRCRRRSSDLAAVIATGRSDYPNQINNVLAFPGVFRGALDVRARRSRARWSSPPRTRSPASSPTTSSRADYIVPSVFNRDVAPASPPPSPPPPGRPERPATSRSHRRR